MPPVSIIKKALPGFAPAGAKKTSILFGGVNAAKNISRS